MGGMMRALRRLPRVSARRGLRASVAGAGTFSFMYEVVRNPTAAFFAAFGAMILLVYVEFAGPKRQRFEQHVGLVVVTLFFVFLGTVCSQILWVAVVSSVLVCFAILMSGVVSSSLAGATNAMLISFLLPVAFQGPLSSIPDRLLGWGVAGVVSLVAIAVIWPAPSVDVLVNVTSGALDKVSAFLDVLSTPATDDLAPATRESKEYSVAAEAAGQLRDSFFAAPFRPAGLSTSTRLLITVIEWTLELDILLASDNSPLETTGNVDVAALLASPSSTTVALAHALGELRDGRAGLEESALRSLHRYDGDGSSAPDSHDSELMTFLGESFRTDNIAETIEKLGGDVLALVEARHRTWWQHALGLDAQGSDSRLDAARRRIRSHLARHSVWLHNSARGALGLGVSVLVAYEFGVEHAFWVVFGTLAVLRSNALSTGQTVVKALTGTIEGIIIGSVIIALLGSHEVVFWILLPFAIFFAGFAPSAISFAAGQAGFTMTILILFNIVEPDGWKIGVVRIEDVALGCAVSLVVGLLLWPRGATASLRFSIAEGIDKGVRYLQSSVAFGLTRCDAALVTSDVPNAARRSAQEAARRLDDAFREFLAERGSKTVTLADVSILVAGVTAVRTTADSIQQLWAPRAVATSADRAVVRAALTQAAESVAQWYSELSGVIVGSQDTLPQPTDFTVSVRELVNTVRRDLSDEDGNATAAAFKIVWTDDYLRQLHEIEKRMIPVVQKIAAARDGSSRSSRRRPLKRSTAAVPV
jgi:uncharacterized membrane protein YccC